MMEVGVDKQKEQITALEIVVAATQVLTVICILKGNSAWKGSLALLFIGAAAKLFYKYYRNLSRSNHF